MLIVTKEKRAFNDLNLKVEKLGPSIYTELKGGIF
jgi:hypothetical protein